MLRDGATDGHASRIRSRRAVPPVIAAIDAESSGNARIVARWSAAEMVTFGASEPNSSLSATSARRAVGTTGAAQAEHGCQIGEDVGMLLEEIGRGIDVGMPAMGDDDAGVGKPRRHCIDRCEVGGTGLPVG